jgi:hypothetical protein
MYVIRFASGKFCNLYCLEEGTAEETAASICSCMHETVRVYNGKDEVLHEFFATPPPTGKHGFYYGINH